MTLLNGGNDIPEPVQSNSINMTHCKCSSTGIQSRQFLELLFVYTQRQNIFWAGWSIVNIMTHINKKNVNIRVQNATERGIKFILSPSWSLNKTAVARARPGQVTNKSFWDVCVCVCLSTKRKNSKSCSLKNGVTESLLTASHLKRCDMWVYVSKYVCCWG